MPKTNKISLFLFRTFFMGLLLFELLNGIGVLDFTVDFTWLGLMVTGAFAWGAAELGMVKFGLKGERSLGLFLGAVCVAVFLDALGDMYHLYSRIDHYDKYLHFINGGLVAYMVHFALRKKMDRYNLGRRFQGVVIVGVVSILGALYEIEEALEDMIISKGQLRSGGNFDTAMDILYNLLGSIIVATMIVYIHNKRKND